MREGDIEAQAGASIHLAMQEAIELLDRQGRTAQADVIRDAADDPRRVFESGEPHAVSAVVGQGAARDCVPIIEGYLASEAEPDPGWLLGVLQTAAIWGSARVGVLLVGRGCDPSSPVVDGVNDLSSLGWAAQADHGAFIRAVVEACPDADLDVADRRGFTSLEIALGQHRLAAADALLEAGATLTGRAIIDAFRSLNGLPIGFVFDHCDDFDFVDKSRGITPLHAVISAYRPACGRAVYRFASQLRERGADPLRRSRKKLKRGKLAFPGKSTALDYAEIVGAPADLVAVLT